jgi:shikimate kinase
MRNIYLVGFMGTGKTSVGKALAKKKKRQFIDLDEFIELREKMTIADIFAKKGEAYFRRVEQEALNTVAKEENFIVACGGGIVINPANIATMKSTGDLVSLSASAPVILRRVSGFVHRPLLNVDDPKGQIEALLKLRAPYYAQADTSIDTSALSVEDVVNEVIKAVQEAARAKVKKRPHIKSVRRTKRQKK